MSNTKALITGSFDPVTLGHLDLVKRASGMFTEVYIVCFINPEKSYMFSESERLEMLKAAVSEYENVKADISHGMVIDYAQEQGINVIVRGIRNAADLAYETEMARFNKENGNIETVFLPADEKLAGISSTYARRIITETENQSEEDKAEKLKSVLPKNILNMQNRPF